MLQLPFPPGEKQPAWMPVACWLGLALLAALALFEIYQGVLYWQTLTHSVDPQGRVLGNDFVNWWTAAKLIPRGEISTLFDFDLYNRVQNDLFGRNLVPRNWSYPPTVFVSILWMGLLPYPVAFVAWSVLGFASYAAAVAYKRQNPWWWVLALALAPSTAINIQYGQTGFFTAACLIGGLRLLERAPVRAGILFGILSFKPHFGLFLALALVLGRYWKTFFAAALTVAALAVLSIVLFGIEPWKQFFVATSHAQLVYLHALPGDFYQLMMISPFMAVRRLGGSIPVSYGVTFTVALTAVEAVVFVFRRTSSVEWRAAVTVTATFLVLPYLFIYDTPAITAVVMSMAAMMMAENPLRTWHLALLGAICILPALMVFLNRHDLPVYPLGMAALLMLQVNMENRKRERTPS